MKQWLGLILLSGLFTAGFVLAQQPTEAPPAPPAMGGEPMPAEGHAAEPVHADAAQGEHGQAAGATHGEHGAAGEHGGHGENKAAETAEHILHHVSDDYSWYFEVPFPPYEAFTVDFGTPLQSMVMERQAGACTMSISEQLKPFPTLGKWLNGCWDFRPTKAILMIWVAMALLGLGLFFGRGRDQNGVPKGMLAHVIESLLLFVRDDIAIPNIGKAEGPRYVPYLATAFFFITMVDYLGLIPGFMFTGTGVLGVTIALAVVTFILTQIAGVRSAGPVGYFTHLFGDVPMWMKPLMFVVEFIGLFTKPFALLIRLFANMLAGHMVIFFLLSLIFVWHVGAAALSVPMTAAIYMLELFVAILQAYIFTLLSALFIGQAVALGQHHLVDDHGGNEVAHKHPDTHKQHGAVAH